MTSSPGARTWKERVSLAMEWRVRHAWEVVDHAVAPLGLEALIRVHWPWPKQKPWERKALTVGAPKGIGDEMMATAVFREIKRRNPDCHLTFVTNHLELMRGVPVIDELLPFPHYGKRRVYWMNYRQRIPPPYPVISLLAASIGLHMPEATLPVAPELPPDPEWDERIAAIPKPRILLQTLASKWTPYKNWNPDHWRAILPRLLELGNVIDTGVESVFGTGSNLGDRFHSFVGKTSSVNLARLVRESSVLLGLVSSGMHLAASYHVPSVILFGGYEAANTHYLPDAICLEGRTPCAPCWLREGCPHSHECMRLVTPEAVLAAVEQQLSRSPDHA